MFWPTFSYVGFQENFEKMLREAEAILANTYFWHLLSASVLQALYGCGIGAIILRSHIVLFFFATPAG
jgi:hypothetical protein